MLCKHLRQLEEELQNKNIRETFRGQAWSNNCREWAYFECILDTEIIKERIKFDDCVVVHINEDSHSGCEKGFVCKKCCDGIMGYKNDNGLGNYVIVK